MVDGRLKEGDKTQRFSKTESGRAEISNRGGKLPRTARNLLLIIDGTRVASNWVELIHGATQADVELLLAGGLIESAHVDIARPKAPTQSLEAAIAGLSYDQLYGLLTSQAKERLGLIRDFRMVRDVQGDGAAKRIRLALGMAA
jgi:hypothetical protein